MKKKVKKSPEKEEKRIIKRPFRIAGVSMVLIALFFVLSLTLGWLGILGPIPIISVLSLSLIFFIFIGFYYLGVNYKDKKFSKIVIVGFTLFISMIIFASSFSGVYYSKLENTLNKANITEDDLGKLTQFIEEDPTLSGEFWKLTLPIFITFLLFAIYLTYFNISLKRLKKIKNVQLISTLNISSIWGILIPYGIFFVILLSAYSYSLTALMFFRESKKAKE